MSEFITITLIALLMIISPGPDFAIVTKTSVSHGRISGIFSAIGVAIANLCHVAINLMGIGVIISQSILAFTIMKVMGAAYLLYIGYKGLRAKPFAALDETATLSQNETVHTAQHKTTPNEINETNGVNEKNNASLLLGRRGFISGYFTSILNPKACLFYLSFFSVMLSANTPLATQIAYGVWMSALACGWFIVVALFFTNPYIGAKLKRCKHWIERITGGALMLLGLRLLSSEAVAP